MATSNEQPTLPQYGRTVWGANDLEKVVARNAKWITAFIIAGVQAVMKDGRPLFTEKASEAEQLSALLTAPPQFWDALEAQDPETAAALVATIIKARAKGKIPAEGPRVEEIPVELTDGELPNDDAGNVGEKGTGTEMDIRLPMFARSNTNQTAG